MSMGRQQWLHENCSSREDEKVTRRKKVVVLGFLFLVSFLRKWLGFDMC